MINCAFVIFVATEGDNGSALRTALPELQGNQEGDVICISERGERVSSPAGQWSIAAVWDYPDADATRLRTIANSLQGRLAQVVDANGYACLVWHEQSSSAVKTNAVTQDLDERCRNATEQKHYTRQGGNELYQAILALLNASGNSPQNFQGALIRLCAHLVPVYQPAIEILSAFLSADLAWQITNSEDAKRALPCGLSKMAVGAKFSRIKDFINAIDCASRDSTVTAAITKVEQYLSSKDGNSLYDMLNGNPETFHRNYQDLRDQLFVLVEAAEKVEQGVS